MKCRQHIFLILAALLASPIIHAEQVTYEIHAVIDQVVDPDKVLTGQVRKGDEIRGTYTFNTAVPDTDSSSQYGHFNQVNDNGNGFDLHINALKTNHRAMAERLFHSINTGNGETDFYYIESKSVTPLGDNFAIHQIGLEIFDHTGKALNNDQLTHEPPDIRSAEDKNLLITGMDIRSKGQFDLKARILSFRNLVKVSEKK